MKTQKLIGILTIFSLLILPAVLANHVTPDSYPFYIFEELSTGGEKITVPFASSTTPLLTFPETAVAGQDVKIRVKVKNIGLAGTTKAECGIYKRQQINSWYAPDVQFFANLVSGVRNIENCLSQQTTVDTVEVNIQKGESRQIDFVVKTPDVTERDESFGIHCATFARCFNEAQNIEDVHVRIGQTDRAVTPIAITGQPFAFLEEDTPATCTDAILNSAESDVDCGGDCTTCANGAGCKSGLDCTSGFCSSSGKCATKPTPLCGNNIVEPGEDCTTCPQDAKLVAGSSCQTKPGETPPGSEDCGNGVVEEGENCVTCRTDVEVATGEKCSNPAGTTTAQSLGVVFLWIGVILLVGAAIWLTIFLLMRGKRRRR